jgi:hypothetical protein
MPRAGAQAHAFEEGLRLSPDDKALKQGFTDSVAMVAQRKTPPPEPSSEPASGSASSWLASKPHPLSGAAPGAAPSTAAGAAGAAGAAAAPVQASPSWAGFLAKAASSSPSPAPLSRASPAPPSTELSAGALPAAVRSLARKGTGSSSLSGSRSGSPDHAKKIYIAANLVSVLASKEQAPGEGPGAEGSVGSVASMGSMGSSLPGSRALTRPTSRLR